MAGIGTTLAGDYIKKSWIDKEKYTATDFAISGVSASFSAFFAGTYGLGDKLVQKLSPLASRLATETTRNIPGNLLTGTLSDWLNAPGTLAGSELEYDSLNKHSTLPYGFPDLAKLLHPNSVGDSSKFLRY